MGARRTAFSGGVVSRSDDIFSDFSAKLDMLLSWPILEYLLLFTKALEFTEGQEYDAALCFSFLL